MHDIFVTSYLGGLLNILRNLTISSLAYSVMYILCNEEPLWMSKCLSTGGLIEYKGSWRKTTLCRYVKSI